MRFLVQNLHSSVIPNPLDSEIVTLFPFHLYSSAIPNPLDPPSVDNMRYFPNIQEGTRLSITCMQRTVISFSDPIVSHTIIAVFDRFQHTAISA
jgi:hypothetical protein